MLGDPRLAAPRALICTKWESGSGRREQPPRAQIRGLGSHYLFLRDDRFIDRRHQDVARVPGDGRKLNNA